MGAKRPNGKNHNFAENSNWKQIHHSLKSKFRELHDRYEIRKLKKNDFWWGGASLNNPLQYLKLKEYKNPASMTWDDGCHACWTELRI